VIPCWKSNAAACIRENIYAKNCINIFFLLIAAAFTWADVNKDIVPAAEAARLIEDGADVNIPAGRIPARSPMKPGAP